MIALVASRDPAFQWEAEVLRSSRQRPVSPAGKVLDDAGDWLTVREASDATGVPASTIRKWARHDNVPSFLEETSDGFLRIVSMRGIERWTEEIGRDIESPDPGSEVDLTTEEQARATREDQAAPEGSMIVPLDAWNRMLNQLGNLHEAGQQLAEARERAAKAETEARFLKERLTDLRHELETAKQPPGTEAHQETPVPRSRSTSPTSIIKKAYDGWRARRRKQS